MHCIRLARRKITTRQLPHSCLFTGMFMNPCRETCQIISQNQTDDTVIIGHSFAYGAKLAAEKFNLPYINICLSPYWLKGFVKPTSFFSSLQRFTSSTSTKFIDSQLFTGPFNALRAEIGLGLMAKSSNRWMFEGTNLCLFAEWMMDFSLEDGFHADFAGFPLRQEEKGSLPANVEGFLLKHEAPIVFTPGTSTSNTVQFFTEALATLKELGRPGVLLSRSHTGLPETLPGNVIHEDFIPLGLLLDKCSAIVHPGGIGTAVQAMAAGIPQLLCPRTDEQRENARQLRRLGICEATSFNSLEHGAMAAALNRLAGDVNVLKACVSISLKPIDLTAEYLKNQVLECGKSKANMPGKCQTA